MRLVAAALAVVALGCDPDTPLAPPAAASAKASSPGSPLSAQARRLGLSRAAALTSASERLSRAVRQKNRTESVAACVAVRRAWRRVEPAARVLALVAASQIDPELAEPDEMPSGIGLRVIADALAEKDVDWPSVERATRAADNAARLAARELETASWDLKRLGVAISRAIFEWGRRLDGSLAESEDELDADVVDGGRALSEWTAIVHDELRARDRAALELLERRNRELARWIEAHGKPPAHKLDALSISGELGAAWRRALVALGEHTARAPFPPARRTRELDHEEPVHLATFPALLGPPPIPERVELGAQLFFDKRLSRNGTMACIDCHRIESALAAGPNRPRAVDGRALPRDVPALWNAAYEPMHFWDGRASTLADQVRIAVENDMGGNWDEIVRRLSADGELEGSFRKAFENGLSAENLREAIAEFERTLVIDATPFDRYVRGDRSAMTPELLAGFDVYFGKSRCSRCHRLPLTSGAIAPRFTKSEASVIGVPVALRSRSLDPDRGRGAATQRAIEEHAFKVPTLRNLAQTAPYFHNGAFTTLEQVVDFYEKGSGAALGIELDNFDPDAAAFELTDSERRALLAFLRDGLRDAAP